MALRRREERDRLMTAVSSGKDIIVFDTETTGFDPESCDIIQFSAVRYRLKNGVCHETDALDVYINPGYHIPAEITAINHISDEMLKDAPDEYGAYLKISEFMDPECLFAGYNVGFDVRFTKALYEHCADSFDAEALDILELAKDLFVKDKNGEKGPVNHKLKSVCDWLGISGADEFHSSINDVRYTAMVMQYCIGTYQEEEKKGTEPESLIVPSFSRSSIRYWVNPRRPSMKRIYVNTDAGDIYYDVIGHTWGTKKADFKNDSVIDFDAFRRKFLDILGLQDEHELNAEKICALGL